MAKKTVYVPRNWNVSYTDATSNEQKNVVLRTNGEYRIVENGVEHFVTVAGIRTENDKAYILVKVKMVNGFMNVMDKPEDYRIYLENVTEIVPVKAEYVQDRRPRNMDTDMQSFTFVFDTQKYSSKYHITVTEGEFVALALKDLVDPSKKSYSIYGHITNVDSDAGEIEFMRYGVANKGVRNVYPYTVKLDALLGVYRYALKISDQVIEEEVVETTEE